jgi:GNAT superfamily N-acetyltransferase
MQLGPCSDSEAIAAVYLASRKECIPYAPLAHSDEAVYYWVAEVLIKTNHIIAASKEGVVYGFIATASVEGRQWINHLYIHPQHTGLGIGSALLEYVLNNIPRPVYLYTFQANTSARRFYERYGFLALEFGNGSGNEEGCPNVLYVSNPAPTICGITMTELDNYLSKHYLNTEQFASACKISIQELNDLLQARLIPAPSYIVSAHSTLKSYVFGEMAAPNATPAHYFHPDNTVWVKSAQQQIKTHGINAAFEILKTSFISRFQIALAECNHRIWPLKDSFNEDGSPITEGLETRSHAAWTHFLQGTFGLCVAHPTTEAAIAEKEVLQEKLNNLSQTDLPSREIPSLLTLIDAFAQASMPFSPIEYPFSSRKRLVDDFRRRLNQTILTIRPMTLDDAAAVSALLPTLD